MSYDSTQDTVDHIRRVRLFLSHAIRELVDRHAAHDESKLLAPEKGMFDQYTQRLGGLTYGSEEYEAVRQEMMGTALLQHYRANDHHPEHHQCGIEDMNLIQVIEMLCDWKAATERHMDGDLRRSISVINKERFGYGDEFERLLLNTAEDLFGWRI